MNVCDTHLARYQGVEIQNPNSVIDYDPKFKSNSILTIFKSKADAYIRSYLYTSDIVQ